MNNLTMGSLFDGIGGFILAGNQAGIDTLWSSEIDPCCEAVTKHHFPNVVQHGDITKINGAKVDPVDIICGGSPCQDLSVAGKRAGLAGERSGLYMGQIRIIREMRAATNNTYPRYMVWENVPGALSSNKGEDFRAVLEEAARCADPEISIPEPEIKNGKLVWKSAGCIVGDGWSIAWRILDAQFWGVPQRRRRIFLVADFGSERAGEILFKPESVCWDSAESGEAGEGIAADAEGGVDGSVYNESGQGYWMPDFGCLRAEGENRPTRPGHCVVQEVKCLNPSMPQSSRIYDARGIYPALSANENGGQNRQAVIVVQGDIARGAHFGQNGCGYSEDGVSYTLNTLDCPAVVFEPKSAFEENWAESTVKNALRAESSKSSHVIVEKTVAAFMGGQGAKARTIAYSENVSPSLKSVPSGGNTVPDIVYGVDCRNATVESELTHTLQAKPGGGFSLNCTPSVIYPEVTGTICASGAGTSRPAGQGNETELCVVQKLASGANATGTLMACHATKQWIGNQEAFGGNYHIVASGKNRKYIIRRLTPLECDRLQGYPDNWSQVPYKGKPMSDSARYRMDGNSVAIPCVVRVLGGIVAQTQDIVPA